MDGDQVQSTYQVGFNMFNPIVSARCGVNAVAKLCPGDTVVGPVKHQREAKFDCVSTIGGSQAETGFVFEANSEFTGLFDSVRGDSLIINHQPWVAKGPKYLALGRTQKSNILWSKIRENE